MGAESSRLRQHATNVSNSDIEQLDLSQQAITDLSLFQFSNAISMNNSLIALRLSRNLIRDNGAISLASAIANNTFLEHLDLSWNGIGSRGAIALAHALRDNRTLRRLNLFGNRIGDDGGMAFEYTVDTTPLSTPLERIDIGFNGIRQGLVDRLQRKLDAKRRSLNSIAGESYSTLRPATALA